MAEQTTPSRPQKRRRVGGADGASRAESPLGPGPDRAATPARRTRATGRKGLTLPAPDRLATPQSQNPDAWGEGTIENPFENGSPAGSLALALEASVKKSAGRPKAARTPRTAPKKTTPDSSRFELEPNEADNVFVSRPAAATPARRVRRAEPSRTVTAPLDADAAMPVIRRRVLAQLSGRSPVELHGLGDQFSTVYTLLEQAAVSGESNTLVLTGPRGSGKSALVEAALQQVKSEYGGLYVVRLDGFIHTDDKLALREIWRQLGRAIDPEEEDGEGGDGLSGSYADTMAKLLATLSHPAEQGGPEGETARAVVFVLAEFERFTTHARQTLLYNLFDIAQSRKAPIAVLGLTTKVSVVESFEKRVKSRFSHRYVHLRPPGTTTEAAAVCRAGLTVDPAGVSLAERAEIGGDWAGAVEWWNECVRVLLESQQFVARFIQPVFYRTKSMSAVFNSLILPVAGIQELPDSAAQLLRQLLGDPGRAVLRMEQPEGKLAALNGLSDVQLGLLIAACRLEAVHGAGGSNFNAAYWEYARLAGRARVAAGVGGGAAGAVGAGASARVWGRDVARAAWERLAEAGLLVGVGVMAGRAQADGLGTGLVRADVGLEEIVGSVDGLDRTFEGWCVRV